MLGSIFSLLLQTVNDKSITLIIIMNDFVLNQNLLWPKKYQPAGCLRQVDDILSGKSNGDDSRRFVFQKIRQYLTCILYVYAHIL